MATFDGDYSRNGLRRGGSLASEAGGGSEPRVVCLICMGSLKCVACYASKQGRGPRASCFIVISVPTNSPVIIREANGHPILFRRNGGRAQKATEWGGRVASDPRFRTWHRHRSSSTDVFVLRPAVGTFPNRRAVKGVPLAVEYGRHGQDESELGQKPDLIGAGTRTYGRSTTDAARGG